MVEVAQILEAGLKSNVNNFEVGIGKQVFGRVNLEYWGKDSGPGRIVLSEI